LIGQLQESQALPQSGAQPEELAGEDDCEVFASTVLGSTDETRSAIFEASDLTYELPTLVLFRGSTQSMCGGASSAVGPHYCPPDKTIYLDETFFDELQARFSAEGGDIAEAHVIAH
jgi:predicted metalloprotease